MPKRPAEYDNLVRTGACHDTPASTTVVAGFISHAKQYLAAAQALPNEASLPRFTLSYEGLYACVQAVLALHGVRTKDAGRQLAIQRVSADLGLSATEFVTFSDAHNRSNGSTYQSPFPPLSEREAKAVLDLLHQLIGLTEAHIATFTTR